MKAVDKAEEKKEDLIDEDAELLKQMEAMDQITEK